jgi:hypothetical protein
MPTDESDTIYAQRCDLALNVGLDRGNITKCRLEIYTLKVMNDLSGHHRRGTHQDDARIVARAPDQSCTKVPGQAQRPTVDVVQVHLPTGASQGEPCGRTDQPCAHYEHVGSGCGKS